MAANLARRAFKPVYLLYYRFLFGRRFPGADRLAARVRALEAAIRQAAGRQEPKTAFAPADAETYAPPPERWDAIVFNECVYYFNDPVGTVRRYEAFLDEGGVFIVSSFRSRRADAIVKRLLE